MKRQIPQPPNSLDSEFHSSGPQYFESGSGLLLPVSPFHKRAMERDFARFPKSVAEAKQTFELIRNDPAQLAHVRAMQREAWNLVGSIISSSSCLQMATLLRFYFAEYVDRIWKYGPTYFPVSFNVAEAFMSYDNKYAFFDLREETEHMLSFSDYISWYTQPGIPLQPTLAIDLFPEGKIYSYDMTVNDDELLFDRIGNKTVSGISFVRHEDELSCILLAGEAFTPERRVEIDLDSPCANNFPGKEDLVPGDGYTTKDGVLPGNPDFTKVILMARFDLKTGTHDVRYIMIDAGPHFRIITDDLSVFLGEKDRFSTEDHQSQVKEELGYYDSLFSLIPVLMYLPAFFVAHSDRKQTIEVGTNFSQTPLPRGLRDTKKFCPHRCHATRRLRCMPDLGNERALSKLVTPPSLEFKSRGYWKAINPREFGKDEKGHIIIGKTWVSTLESWSASSPRKFLLDITPKIIDGPDPGEIYVMRESSQVPNIFKIGLTRKNAAGRAKELSSATGVPTPFLVMAQWKVKNCAKIERLVHERLADQRINERREFFHAEISVICSVINDIIFSSDD